MITTCRFVYYERNQHFRFPLTFASLLKITFVPFRDTTVTSCIFRLILVKYVVICHRSISYALVKLAAFSYRRTIRR